MTENLKLTLMIPKIRCSGCGEVLGDEDMEAIRSIAEQCCAHTTQLVVDQVKEGLAKAGVGLVDDQK